MAVASPSQKESVHELAEMRELVSPLSPRLRATDGADQLIVAIERVATCDPAELAACATVVSERLRLLFYASIARRPPSDLRSAPTYVTSVQRRYNLQSRNAARELLARVEGCHDWKQLMKRAIGTSVR